MPSQRLRPRGKPMHAAPYRIHRGAPGRPGRCHSRPRRTASRNQRSPPIRCDARLPPRLGTSRAKLQPPSERPHSRFRASPPRAGAIRRRRPIPRVIRLAGPSGPSTASGPFLRRQSECRRPINRPARPHQRAPKRPRIRRLRPSHLPPNPPLSKIQQCSRRRPPDHLRPRRVVYRATLRSVSPPCPPRLRARSSGRAQTRRPTVGRLRGAGHR